MLQFFPILAMLAAAPAIANDKSAEDAATTKPAASAEADKKICRIEGQTGSIMRRRTCHTKAEWAAMEEKAKSDLQRIRDQERSKSMVAGNR